MTPTSRRGGSLRRIAPRLLGPAILALLLTRIPLARTLDVIAAVRPWPAVAAVVLLLPLLAIRTHRWTILVRAQGLRLAAGEALAVYAFAVFAGVATPGRLGEFVKVAHLRQRGLAFGRAFAAVFLDRFLDVLVLTGMGTWGLASFAGLSLPPATAVAALAVAAAVAALYAVTRGTGGGVLARLTAWAMPGRLGERASGALTDFGRAMTALTPSALALTAAESVAGWLVNWLALALLAMAIGVHVSFLYLAAATSVCGLLAMLPVSVLGLGTRDATLVAMFARVGITPPAALAFSLMNLLLLLTYGLLCSVSLLSPTARLGARSVRAELTASPPSPPEAA